MSQIFDKIRVSSSKRSTFDLSHNQVMTSDFGYITPICVRDMVPNDDFVVNPQAYVRLTPMAVPTYGRIKCRIHHFFVPYRILYPDWDSFIVQDPNNHTLPPFFTVSTLRQALATDPQFGGSSTTLKRGTYGRLMANLGINPDSIENVDGLDPNDRISAFPFLAYYRIWLDWFMDSNIYDHAAYDRAFKTMIESGGSMATFTTLLETRNCCYKKDYYTTARVSPQGGFVNPTPNSVDPSVVTVDLASIQVNPGLVRPDSQYNGIQILPNGSVKTAAYSGSSQNSKLGQFTVEALRAANSLQRYLERNNFVGTKIINRILAHFGVAPTPERLDMAEFIDGESFDIGIGDVTSTAFTGSGVSTSGLGLQAGKGLGTNSKKSKSVRYHAKEHGVFMSLMSIIPDTAYYQGIPKLFQKGVFGDPLDYFTPEFENLGYQPILNKEVFVPSLAGQLYQSYDPDGIFGYTPRYSEYKFQNDVLSGDFVGAGPDDGGVSNYMDSWHLFRHLNFDEDNPLTLNENFVELKNHNTDYDRIFQITTNDYDHFYFNIFVDVKATRPMDGFTAPSIDETNHADGREMNLPYGGTRL